MQSSICGGAEGLGHAQPSHDFLEAHDMFWWIGECGVKAFIWLFVHGSRVLFVFASSMAPDGEVPIGDPAIWGPTSDFGFLSAWANYLGCDFFPWFGVHFGLLRSGVSPHTYQLPC